MTVYRQLNMPMPPLITTNSTQYCGVVAQDFRPEKPQVVSLQF